ITITGISARGHHGVYDHEKRDGQEFVVDITVHTDLRRASTSDTIDDTVHYGELAELAVAEIEGPPTAPIDTLAERLATATLHRWPVPRVRVTVHKPHAPITVPFTDVSVTIERGPHTERTGQ